MKFSGKSKGSKFVPDDKEKVANYLSTLEGEKIVVGIDKWRKTRSTNANAYYWFLINILVQDLGYTKDELHKFFGMMFIPMEVSVGNNIMIIPKSTTSLDTKEFTIYIEQIRDYSENTIGIRLPQANEIPLDQLEKFYNLS